MRVKILLLAVFAFVAMNVNGQELKFGAKAGLNISNFTGSDANSKSKMGFHFGGFAQYAFSDALYLQPELLLSFEGAKDKDNDNKVMSVTYLNIPVMVGYKIGSISLEAGPQIGFLLGAKYDGETEVLGSKVKDWFKSTDFCLNLGAGYAITENIGVGVRYCIGLSNVSDNSDTNFKTSNFQVSVGYKF